MNTRHKHYECIVAWAEGKKIQYKAGGSPWLNLDYKFPSWLDDIEYRIKPEKKSDGQLIYESICGLSWEDRAKETKLYYEEVAKTFLLTRQE